MKDALALVAPTTGAVADNTVTAALSRAPDQVYRAYPDPDGRHRPFQVVESPWRLDGAWSDLFIQTINTDGILQWAREPAPPGLSAVAECASAPVAAYE
jgi:hypothetical protein